MKVAIIGGDGFGGFMQSANCAHFARQNSKDEVHLFYAANEDKAIGIRYLYPDVKIIPEEYQQNYQFLRDPSCIERFKLKFGTYDKYYFHAPDLLWQNEYAFEYKRFKTTPLAIKTYRGLTHLYNPSKKIYIAHISTTENYSYPKIIELIDEIAARLPNHEIIVPILESWAANKLDYSNIVNHQFSDNVKIKINPSFIESIKDVCTSEYTVCCDNGMSHLSHNLGQPNLLLDGRYMQLPWMVRWKESFENCVPMETPPDVLGRIVEINVKQPISTLIDRKFLFNIQSVEDFNSKIYLKNI